MPCHTRMKTVYLRGLLWLYLLGFGYLALCVEPGFLDFDNLPDTNFSCVGKVIGGYYADLETNCQMFHVCTIGQLDEPMDIRFLCLNGTVFDQETRVCERIDEVDCSKSEKFYSLNLELYGNTQPSIAEDNVETDPPIIIKASTTTTTTTTTTTAKPKTKPTKTAFFTTGAPSATTVTKVISSHHFPISTGPDIRFNPEEINISLNPGASPSVRSKSVTYQQQVFNGNDNNKKVVVTTHTSYGTPDKDDFVRVTPNTQRTISSTQRVKNQSPATPADINYGFTYHQTEDDSEEYTEPPRYQYHHSNIPFRHGQFRNQFKTTTYRSQHLPTTRKHTSATYRTHPYASSVKTPTYHTYRTDKPQRLQLPLPLLPTLPPLTFSSPAPFTLGHHVETKRYTNDHQAPPRIIISASASVSDNSGRRLNYSLGTIGVTPLLEEPPKSYDDYKDHDVVLDPFYHDVPKIKARRKRQTNDSDQAAADVLKFLFDWYNKQKSTPKVPINSEDITEINQELAPLLEAPITQDTQNRSDEDFKESALFKQKSKFNIIGDILSVTEPKPASTERTTSTTVPKLDTVDYVDDNYEAVAQENVTATEEVTTVTETTLAPTTTIPTTTSRIMALMRKRAKVHHKRIMNENRRRYEAAVNALKPKVRRRDKQRTTEANIEEIVSQPEAQVERLSTTDTTSAASVNGFRPKFRRRNKQKTTKAHRVETTTLPEAQVERLSTIGTTTTLAIQEELLTTAESIIKAIVEEVEGKAESTDKGESSIVSDKNEEEVLEEKAKLTVKDEEHSIMSDKKEEVPEEETRSTDKDEEGSSIVADKNEEHGAGLEEKDSTDKEERDHSVVPNKNEEDQVAEERTKSTDKDEEGSSIVADKNEEHGAGLEEKDSTDKEEREHSVVSNKNEEDQVAKERAKLTDKDVGESSVVADKNEEDKQVPEEEDATDKVEIEHSDKNLNAQNQDSQDLVSESFNNFGHQDPHDQINQESIGMNIEAHLEEITTETEEPQTEITSQEEDEESLERFSSEETTTPLEEERNREELDGETASQNEETHLDAVAEAEGHNLLEQHEGNEAEQKLQANENDDDDFGEDLKEETLMEPTEETKIEEGATEEGVEISTVPELDPNDKSTDEETLSKPQASDDDDFETETSVPKTETTHEDHFDDNMVPTEQNEETTSYSSSTIDDTTLDVENMITSTTESYDENTTVESTTSTTSGVETTSTSSTLEFDTLVSNLTPAETTTAASVARTRRPRPPRVRTSPSYRKPNSRHRFSTEVTARPTRRKQPIEFEIVDAIRTTESLKGDVLSTSPTVVEDVPTTDAPLYKSANPTQAESAKESLHTTPLSMAYKLHVRKSYIFNCFGKAINRFYSDPRDCRLFHYCTSGYTKNQLLDMKFVCDQGTYFDEERLICTAVRPARCL